MAHVNNLSHQGYLVLLCAVIAALGFSAEVQAQTRMLKTGTSMNDVLSKRVIGESWIDGNSTVQVILIGNRLVFENQDGTAIDVNYFDSSLRNTDLARQGIAATGTCLFIQSNMWQDFKKRKEVVGQANLSLRVNANRTCEILTQTIYVPGCAPYRGGTAVDPKMLEFLQQIKSAVAAIEPQHLQMPAPQYKSFILEVVIGRDASMFPRYATAFNGMIVRDASGKSQHTKAFVSDAVDK